jgi:hypothetical protein
VGQRRLQTVLADFARSVQDCRQLAVDAHSWAAPGAHGARPYLSLRRRDSLVEMAFLRAFLAWEVFVEESFVLYLAGQKPPRGRAPFRHAFPPNHKIATEWVVPEGRPYARWTIAGEVSQRAERFFRDGRPFAGVLRGNQTALDETRIIRNAIAHKSTSARLTFETLAREKLLTLPPNLTVGAFLGTIVPGGAAPPTSFLEFYISKIDLAAKMIVPS